MIDKNEERLLSNIYTAYKNYEYSDPDAIDEKASEAENLWEAVGKLLSHTYGVSGVGL